LVIDLDSRQVTADNSPVNLTKKENNLLLFFMGNKNRVLSKATLPEHLSGDFATCMTTTTLSMHTSKT
jgi:DNA-binding response OmpR family regulator